MIPGKVLDTIEDNRARHLEELLDFLRIPSVSTLSEHAADIRDAAGWVLGQLRNIGFEGRVLPTERHPVVLARRSRRLPGAPALLIYGHYDVQPPDPLDQWKSPPFSPQVREGFVFARGATDDKGQFFTYVKAMESVLAVEKELPLNVTVLVEGEEEIASPSLEKFLSEHREELGADAVAISDSSQFAAGIPAITYGLRGLSYVQIDVQGPNFDLHSGAFGGIVSNPAQVLAEILTKLKNRDATVAIPGFYDEVLDLEEWERREIASLPVDEAALAAYLGVADFPGEPGYSVIERKTARPTLDVYGIWGGFSGEGSKTIIPAKAGAKVSMRLVPNQKPAEINSRFRRFVQSLTPPGIKLQISELHGADPVLVRRDHPTVQAAAKAIETGFGRPPVFIREGGSIPVVNLMKEVLGIENILLLGWGRPDDGAHSPNERFAVEDFHRGIRSAAALLYELAALK